MRMRTRMVENVVQKAGLKIYFVCMQQNFTRLSACNHVGWVALPRGSERGQGALSYLARGREWQPATYIRVGRGGRRHALDAPEIQIGYAM